MITKKFEVEGEEDKIIQPLIDKKSKKTKIVQKVGKDLKTYNLTIPIECRSFQLDSLLNFKNRIQDLPKENQYIYHEVEDLTQIDMNDYCSDIQAVLVSPPWKDKNFSIDRLVNIIF